MTSPISCSSVQEGTDTLVAGQCRRAPARTSWTVALLQNVNLTLVNAVADGNIIPDGIV